MSEPLDPLEPDKTVSLSANLNVKSPAVAGAGVSKHTAGQEHTLPPSPPSEPQPSSSPPTHYKRDSVPQETRQLVEHLALHKNNTDISNSNSSAIKNNHGGYFGRSSTFPLRAATNPMARVKDTMLSASHIITRGRSHAKEDSSRRSSSHDCAAAAAAQGSIFSFLTAAVKNKYNRFDTFEGDNDEDDMDDQSVEEAIQDEERLARMAESMKSYEEDIAALQHIEAHSALGVQKMAQEETKQDQDDNTADHQSQLETSVHSVYDSPSSVRKRSQSVGNLDCFLSGKEKTERASALTDKLRSKLGLDDNAVLIGEYPCWLLKSILLQGHLYITERHVCFFAYLPRKREIVLKSGSLSKKSKRTPKYSRFWFVLRNDSLSYYPSSTDLYFPSGSIDLRYAIKAERVEKTEVFNVMTEDKTYVFKADSPNAANDWVKAIQREIFKSRNEGDNVKIVIPVENIIDIEETPVFEIGETVKIRAIDGDDTFAIDEYVIALFTHGQEALMQIKDAMKNLGVTLDPKPDQALGRSVSEHVIDTTSNADFSQQQPLPPPTPQSPKSSGPGRFRSIASVTSLDFVSRSRSRSPSTHSGTPPRSTSPFGSLKNLATFGRSRSNTVRSTASTSASHDEEDNDRYDILSASETREAVGSASTESSAKVAKRKPAYSLSMVNKVTEMWEGGIKHFSSTPYTNLQEDPYLVSPQDEQESNERYRSHFGLKDDEFLIAAYYAHIQKAIPVYGKLYLSTRHLCFRSLIPGTKTKMILPLADVENATKEKGFRFGYSGLVVIIHGHEEIFFEFGGVSNRDDCEMMVLKQIELTAKGDSNGDESLAASYQMHAARLMTFEEAINNRTSIDLPPALVDDDSARLIAEKPKYKKHFTMLTIGSRGDVQPYIALAKGLMKEGHQVRIATHLEFKDWIEKHGIEFREIAGDPGELMKIMIEHGMLSVSFIREATARFRTWIDELLTSSWKACQGTDVLIESPSAMAGIHVAEALNIPYFRAFTMPWTRTRAYPHAFIVPEQKMGGSYNYLTYVLFDNVFWKGISSQVNKWRTNTLGIARTNLEHMQQTKVPFLYNVSPTIFVPPMDFSDWIRVTGYWFLDEGGDDFQPPEDLVKFLKKARDDKCKVVYIGFGSIVVSNAKEMTKAIVQGVEKAGVRCILAKGWSDRFDDDKKNEPEVELPDCIHLIKSVPHDWLFPKVDAAVHHGGSGTTGASLRAGLPTIIKPYFGDQFFYAGRIEDLGVGLHLHKLTVAQLSKALWEVTHNDRIISRAKAMGASIRSEDGVSTAIISLYRNLDYAASLSRVKYERNAPQLNGKQQGRGSPPAVDEDTDGSWTIVDPQSKKAEAIIAANSTPSS